MFFHFLFGQVNISCGQVENEVQLVRGQVEKIQNSTPLLLLLLLYIFMLNVLLICLKTRAKLMILTGFDTV